VAKALMCLLLLAAAIMGAAPPAFAACLPVNGLTFEPEPDCNTTTASAPATRATVMPAAPAPIAPAAVAAPAPQTASAPPPERAQPLPPAPASDVAERSPSSQLYRVQKNLSDGFLALRSGPGGQYEMIVRIPAGTEGLSVAECPRSPDGSRPWCRVSWKGKTGWVFNRYIQQN
jgi:hypothetical protein